MSVVGLRRRISLLNVCFWLKFMLFIEYEQHESKKKLEKHKRVADKNILFYLHVKKFLFVTEMLFTPWAVLSFPFFAAKPKIAFFCTINDTRVEIGKYLLSRGPWGKNKLCWRYWFNYLKYYCRSPSGKFMRELENQEPETANKYAFEWRVNFNIRWKLERNFSSALPRTAIL